MRVPVLLALSLLAIAWGPPPSLAAPELSVTVVPRSASGLARDATIVHLEGEIDAGAPDRLSKALEGIEGSIVVWLNSPGGNLFAGMQLGRVIRSRGGWTHVINPRTLLAGECYSACAMTFLGGVYRFNDNGARYGVHRAALPTRAAGSPDLVGELSPAVGAYMREMGVDDRLLTLWGKAAPDEMYVLSQREAEDLRVANNGRKLPEWRVATSAAGRLLQGRQETIDGTGLLLLSCDQKRTTLGSVYEAVGVGEAAGDGEWSHAITFDRFEEFSARPLAMSRKEGLISARFVLPPSLVRRAMSARQIGQRMTPSGSRPASISYGVDIDDAARPTVRTFLRDCLRAQGR